MIYLIKITWHFIWMQYHSFRADVASRVSHRHHTLFKIHYKELYGGDE